MLYIKEKFIFEIQFLLLLNVVYNVYFSDVKKVSHCMRFVLENSGKF